MAWTVIENEELEIIELNYSGRVSALDINEATSRCISLGKKTRIKRYLINATKIELAASMIDLLRLPEKQYVEENADKRVRVALLPPTTTEGREAAQFYETACKNRGWRVQILSTRKHALDWLFNK